MRCSCPQSSFMDQVWLLCEAAAASSNASRMWEAAAEAASAEEILEAASAEEILEAASAEEILVAASGEEILAPRAKAKWRRTNLIGHRVLVPHPPADAPPANLLREVDRRFAASLIPLDVGLQVPRPKKRPAPSSAASSRLVPHPPAEAPPEGILWAAMVAGMLPQEVTPAALARAARPPVAKAAKAVTPPVAKARK